MVTRGMKIGRLRHHHSHLFSTTNYYLTGFCLEDYLPATFPLPPLGKSRYDCAHQGISAGWADQYHKNLDCQWIDVTDVPDGFSIFSIRIRFTQ